LAAILKELAAALRKSQEATDKFLVPSKLSETIIETLMDAYCEEVTLGYNNPSNVFDVGAR
jgi:hypothetical protein